MNRARILLLALVGLVGVTISCNNSENNESTESSEEDKNVVEPLSEEELLTQIEALKKDMEDDEMQDEKKLNKLIALCMDLVSNYPDAEQAPRYLDLAAQLAYAKGNVRQSVNYYEKLIEQYPDFDELEYSYYMYANHLDLDLRKIEEATAAYEAFIEKFPNSQFIPEAKMRLENIDMGMEEIIGKAQ